MESTAVTEGRAEELHSRWDIRYIKDVVENGLCTFCGACIALCDKIKPGKEVADVAACPSDCPTCIPCPRLELLKPELEWKLFGKKKGDETLGNYIGAYAAKTSDAEILKVCQDGGVATTLLKYLLENRIVDGVVSVRGKGWKSEGFLARGLGGLMEGAGTKYTSCPSLVAVARSITEEGLERLAFIGTPCEVQAIRKIQDTPDYRIIGDKVRVVLGIFCMESYYNALIDEFVRGKLGIVTDGITKFDIKGQYMNIHLKGKRDSIRVPLEEIKRYTREACHACLDFSAELADISIGSVGSPSGWSTVLTRTKLGDEIYEGAVEKGVIASERLKDLEEVRKISRKKQRANLRNIAEKLPKMQISRRGGINLAKIYRTYRWRSE